ncbi:long-chain-fatty-acid--CoA ligase [Desulfocucumis palustris]|uniref:Long-chain-fatty-acid--CoA ligase n=1 Tax=Desulfocucumis palustris TaxID=1898651 RepID=A0A2L2XAQ0_9FIRM|nr:long-chain fatty acid--CoA ligase [Desulfocucumis palustris]GBF33054.1 long-chain-fatty-acid--CoA ligase [Desulfocucumis palustris]
MDIGGLLSLHARKTPFKEALVYEDKRYSYGELNAQANRMAHALIQMGIKKGDKVSLMMQNSHLYVMAFFGILKAGAVAVPVNYRLALPEVLYILEQSDSKVFIFDPEYEPLALEISKSMSPLFIKASGPAAPENMRCWEECVKRSSEEDPDIIVDEWDDCEILYTSGTTGRPKGALFDHHRILHVALNMVVHLGINPKDRLLHVAPLFHSAQLNLFLVSGMYVGASHVAVKIFAPERVLKTISDERITLFFGVPTMYNFMLQVPDPDKYDLSSVRRLGYGAAPMAPELVKRCMEFFGNKNFYNLCGLTEGGPGGILLEPEDQLRKPGAGGKAINNLEARVVDAGNNDVKPDQVGEFIIRGETIMKCYYKNPEATGEALKNGWLYTGDLATVDEEGYITLVDRKKDMIISGGENVYSTEVEQVLYEYPDILEAAVIGVPNPVWGETVLALVCPKLGRQMAEADLKAFCQTRLAAYKVPRVIEFIDALPRNASGKVLKNVLRNKYKLVK